jgi:hypothetical protein
MAPVKSDGLAILGWTAFVRVMGRLTRMPT